MRLRGSSKVRFTSTAIRAVVVGLIALQPLIHGHFHAAAAGHSHADACLAATNPVASTAMQSADECPICNLMVGGVALPPSPFCLAADAAVEPANLLQQCYGPTNLTLASSPARAPPA